MSSIVTETNSRNNNVPGSFMKSAGFAFNGIKGFFKSERNGKIQAAIAVVVFLAGILLSISMMEWLVIILFTSIVISMEMFNSALEKLCDHISSDWHPRIKLIKDMAAGAVLWASLLSVLAGLCIFIPKIIELL